MAFDDPFRLRVLKALTAALADITPANDYAFDLTDAVFRGRTEFGDGDPLPMLSILDGKEPGDVERPNADDSNEAVTTWSLVLQGFVEDDHRNPTDPAEQLLAATKQRLGEERARQHQGWPSPLGMGVREVPEDSPNNVISLNFGFGVARPPDEFVSDKAYFWLPVTIELSEDHSRPFD
jgi:hypothetical protein